MLLLIKISNVAVLGLCILCSETAHQQAHSGSLHGQPWAVHAPPQTWHHRSAADEGSGSGGEEPQEDGEVRVTKKEEKSGHFFIFYVTSDILYHLVSKRKKYTYMTEIWIPKPCVVCDGYV